MEGREGRQKGGGCETQEKTTNRKQQKYERVVSGERRVFSSCRRAPSSGVSLDCPAGVAIICPVLLSDGA